MKKLNTVTKNIGRCTELRFEWLGFLARKASNFYVAMWVPVEPKLVFVIRIRGISGVSPKI